MKFFRITNGDIVTSIRPLIGTPGIKALRLYDAKNKCYCFEERTYRGSLYAIKSQLNKDAAACLRGQLGNVISQHIKIAPEVQPELIDKPWYSDLKDRALGLLP